MLDCCSSFLQSADTLFIHSTDLDSSKQWQREAQDLCLSAAEREVHIAATKPVICHPQCSQYMHLWTAKTEWRWSWTTSVSDNSRLWEHHKSCELCFSCATVVWLLQEWMVLAVSCCNVSYSNVIGNKNRSEQHIHHLKERRVPGSKWSAFCSVRKGTMFNQTSIRTISCATLRGLLRDGVELVWAFLGAGMPYGMETETETPLGCVCVLVRGSGGEGEDVYMYAS